jgi:hypothetical protein
LAQIGSGPLPFGHGASDGFASLQSAADSATVGYPKTAEGSGIDRIHGLDRSARSV